MCLVSGIQVTQHDLITKQADHGYVNMPASQFQDKVAQQTWFQVAQKPTKVVENNKAYHLGCEDFSKNDHTCSIYGPYTELHCICGQNDCNTLGLAASWYYFYLNEGGI